MRIGPPAVLDFRTALKREAPASADRAPLRAAIAALAEANRAAAVAAGVAKRAAAEVRRARAALDGFAGLQERVVAHRTAQLEAGEANSRALPADILADRAALAAAEDDAGDAEATHAKLLAKAGALAAAAEEARSVVQARVVAVMSLEARQMVERVRRLEAEAGQLRVDLMSYANQFAFADQVLNPVPAQVRTMFQEPAHAALIAALGLTLPPSVVAWADYRKRLTTDPAATIEASQPSQERAHA